MKAFANLLFWNLVLWGGMVFILLLPPLAVAAYTPRPIVFIIPSLSPWTVVFVCVSQLGVLTGAMLVTQLRGHAVPLWSTLTLALLLFLTACGCLWTSPVYGPNLPPRVWDIRGKSERRSPAPPVSAVILTLALSPPSLRASLISGTSLVLP
jgi:hypothetical protein